jgi:hypothetical protein
LSDFLTIVRTNKQVQHAYKEYLEDIQKRLDRDWKKVKDPIAHDILAGKKFLVATLLEEAC